MANEMDKLAGAAIGVLLLVVIFAIVPLVGSQIDDATPALGNDSDWNATTNTDIATGADLWESVGSMISLAAILAIVGVVIGAVMKFRESN